jgi:hypothetical protein
MPNASLCRLRQSKIIVVAIFFRLVVALVAFASSSHRLIIAGSSKETTTHGRKVRLVATPAYFVRSVSGGAQRPISRYTSLITHYATSLVCLAVISYDHMTREDRSLEHSTWQQRALNACLVKYIQTKPPEDMASAPVASPHSLCCRCRCAVWGVRAIDLSPRAW